MAELKNCPFCGDRMRKRAGFGGLTYFYCENNNCGAIVSFNGKREIAPGVFKAENPIANFNRRVLEGAEKE